MNMAINSETFVKKLQGVFELEVEGTKSAAFSNHLKDIEVHFHPYGYEARVHFATYDNKEMSQLFMQTKTKKATLTFKSADSEDKGTEVLKLQGIVTGHSCQSLGQQSRKGIEKIYTVYFKDPAQVGWEEHFPRRIFVGKTMKDVIDAEKTPSITIAYDWDVLTQVKPILAFSLEPQIGTKVDQHPSFYSFLTWYLHQFNGVLEYDYEKNSYTIRGKKDEGAAPKVIPEWISTAPECQLPSPLRFLDRTIRPAADAHEFEDAENPDGIQGVRRDLFNDANYFYFPDQISQKIKSKLLREKPYIRFSLTELAEFLNVDELRPGRLIEFKKNDALPESWVDDPLFKGKPYRIVNVYFRASIDHELLEIEKLDQFYHLELKIEAEAKEELYVERPAFTPPAFPFFVQGKVVSKEGDEEQTTFHITKPEKALLPHYLMTTSLTEEGEVIPVPFFPHIISGQHYFPLCKDQKVMLEIHFQTAAVARSLNHQNLVQPPIDNQMNQTVFGSNGIDRYVLQRHEFEDGKNSVFTLKQSASSDHSKVIRMREEEGDLVLSLEEKGKAAMSVRFHTDALSVEYKSEESGVTQQSVYTPESITHISKKGEDKSAIILTPESISMTSKKIEMECDEMSITAKKTISQNAGTKMFLDTPIVNASGKMKVGK